ncbi:MAG: RagB/SusD family nutrient uptake outer membrane protein [Bacteroidota bacterium]
MKITKIVLSSLLMIFISFTACNDDEFLEVLPPGSLAEDQLQTRAGLEASLIASYSTLLGRRGSWSDASNWFWGGVLGGDANKGTDPGDASQLNEIMRYEPQAVNDAIEQIYSTNFEGIARANATLRILANVGDDVSAEFKTRIEGETRFLRAHYYFALKRIFNNVPYVDETWDGEELVPNNRDLYEFIEADFQFAFDNLPETQSEAGRANKWAAGAYLGKAFIFQEKFAEAKAILDQVIADGVTASGDKYDLLPNYPDAFRMANDNSPESVFASQAAANTGTTQNANPGLVLNFPHGGTGRPGGCCGFNQPSFDLANSFRTDANGLPLLDGSYNDAGNALVSDNGVTETEDFTPDAGNLDPRLDHSIGRRGIPYLDWGNHPGVPWIRNQPNGGPYSPKKFIYSLAGEGTENDGSSWTPGYTAVNYNIIRFADVLLLAAEAEVALGNLETARALVNRVRERAANSILTKADDTPAANYVISTYDAAWTDQAVAREAVRFERKLELSGEGHRFFDLVRWGIAAETLNAYLVHENANLSASPLVGATFTAGVNEYLPLPQRELDLINGAGEIILVQNPGYN